MLNGKIVNLKPLDFNESQFVIVLLEKVRSRFPRELYFLNDLPYTKYDFVWENSKKTQSRVHTSIWTPGIFHIKPFQNDLFDHIPTSHSPFSIAAHLIGVVPDLLACLYRVWSHKKRPIETFFNALAMFNPTLPFDEADVVRHYIMTLLQAFNSMPGYWSLSVNQRALTFDEQVSKIGICFTDAQDLYQQTLIQGLNNG